jgi:hypothetical protein
MSWYISVNINESSRDEAISQLEKAIEDIKMKENVFHDLVEQDPNRIPYLAYDSYEGI